MANKKKEYRFTLTDEDYRSFGRYRILYTEQGRKLVGRQRATYLITAVAIAGLFTLFHVDHSFTMMMYVIAAAMAVVGIFFAEKLVLRQQDRVIEDDKNSAERVYAAENVVTFGDDGFMTRAGNDEQNFKYSDIKLVDLTEEGIYVWMSDTVIMPLPLHAFRSMDEMKEFNKWLKGRVGA